MRGVFILLALIGVVVIGGYTYLHHHIAYDRGHLLAVAFGVPLDDTIELHVAVSDMMTLRDPPQVAPTGRLLWEEWVRDHWVLLDSSGQRLTLRRRGSSAVMGNFNAAGSPKFYLTGTLKQNEDHTLDFIPVGSKGERYRYAFTAPSEPQDPWRMKFEPVRSNKP